MRKKIFINLMIIIIGLGCFNRNPSSAKKNIDLFNGILNTTGSITVENGLKVSFEINGDSENYCLDFFKKLQIYDADVNIIKDKDLYCLEFKKTGLNGYIEYMNLDNHNVVTLNIVREDKENKLLELKNLVTAATGKDSRDIKYFEYLKAKLPNDNLVKINEDITSFLKGQDAVNIYTTYINNGYSTVAYTRKYSPIKNNGKLMDFNFAVCSYSSGNYVIIGTPVIFTTY